ncbi:universal stress protein [Halobacteriaceae bacterium SHR40]|uniref:universal stress protein n=1 Tax=Halovenus amylolytica TaxID=2500550 RepID=UPI000FE3A539
MSRQTVLLPVIFPDPALHPLSDSSITGLENFDIELFGYWKIPENTTPEVARESHETEAEAVLYEMAAAFSRAGASTEIELYFGPGDTDNRELQNRISDETDCDVVLIADNLTAFNNILVPMRDDRHERQIVDFVSLFDVADIFVLELYHATADERSVESAEQMLDSVEETLLDGQFTEADIETTVEVTDDAKSAIAEKARGHNIVVTGQPADGRLFSPVYEYIDDHTTTPIAVVRD